MPFDEARGRRMDVQLAEAAAEGLLLVGRQALVAKEDHAVVDGTGMGRKLLRTERPPCHRWPSSGNAVYAAV